MFRLVLLRHGESEWNQDNKFGGWTDLRLSAKGEHEATQAGLKLKAHGYLPEKVYTSKLTRAIQTANRALEACDRLWVDIVHTYRLNERHYGALQGRNKEAVERKYGHAKYMQFRRSLDVAPPPIDPDDEYSQVGDPRYAAIEVPLTENLHAMTDRIRPAWVDSIADDLRTHRTVLVVGHGNSLRGLIKLVRRVSNEEIKSIDLRTGVPFVIELDHNLRVVDPENWCHYLD